MAVDGGLAWLVDHYGAWLVVLVVVGGAGRGARAREAAAVAGVHAGVDVLITSATHL